MFWLRTFLLLSLAVWIPTGAALFGSASIVLDEADRVGTLGASMAVRSVDAAFVERAVDGWSHLTDLNPRAALVEVGRKEPGPAAAAFLRATTVDGRALGFLVTPDGQVFPNELAVQVSLLVPRLLPEVREKERWRGAWALSDDSSHTVAAISLRDDRREWLGVAAKLQPVDLAFVRAASGGVDLTLLHGFEVALTTLRPQGARSVVEPAFGGQSRFRSGALAEPLPTGVPGFGPLGVGSHAEGHAYASEVIAVPGSDLRWVVSQSQRETLAVAGRVETWVVRGCLIMTVLVSLVGWFAARRPVIVTAREREPGARPASAVSSPPILPLADDATPPSKSQEPEIVMEAPEEASVPMEDPEDEDYGDLDDLSLSRALPGEMTIAAMNTAPAAEPVVVDPGTEYVVELEPYELSMAAPDGVPLEAYPVPSASDRQEIRAAYHAFVAQRESGGERGELDFQRFAERLVRRRRLHEERHGPSESVRYEVYERFGEAAIRIVFGPHRRTG